MQINCPYCNAAIDANELTAAGPRVRCPRCGDSFPNQWLTDNPGEASKPSAAEPADQQMRRSNRLAAVAVVGVMALMAGVGLIYALWTVPERQQRHPDPIEIFATHQYRPSALPALGYLPFDTCIAAGIHLADIRKDGSGDQLLKAPRWEPLAWTLDRLELWTDLKPDAIDHIALGVNVPPDELPGLVMVAQTRRPYGIHLLRKKFGAEEELYGRALFRFKLRPLGAGCLWCADERTLVVVLRIDGVQRAHLDRIPFKSHQGMEGLPDEMQRLIKERLPAQPVAWIVGEMNQLTANAELLKLLPAAGKLADYLTLLRRFAAGMQLEKEIIVQAAFEAKDANAAYAIQEMLEKLDKKGLKLIGMPPPQVLATRCIGQGTSGALDALALPALLSQTWVLAQYRGDVARIRETLNLWKEPANGP